MAIETMLRAAMLLLLATAVTAGEPVIEAELFDAFVYLAAGDSAVHEMEADAVEVHFLFRFRYGLYSLGPKGEVADATAGVRIEIDHRGRGFRPVFMQSDLNPDWNGPATRPGTFFTRAQNNRPLERRIIVRLAQKGRYKLRITGLLADSAAGRRVPILIGIAEVRDLPLDVKHPWEPPPPRERRPPVREEFHEEQPEPRLEEEFEPEEKPLALHPQDCPFCGTAMGTGVVIMNNARNYPCRRCSGAVHLPADAAPYATVLDGGRRRRYEIREGRAVGYTRPDPVPTRGVRAASRRRDTEEASRARRERFRRAAEPVQPIHIPLTFGLAPRRPKLVLEKRRPSRAAASRGPRGQTRFVRPRNSYGRVPTRRIRMPNRIRTPAVRKIAMPRRIR